MSMWAREPATAAEVVERARAVQRRLQAQRCVVRANDPAVEATTPSLPLFSPPPKRAPPLREVVLHSFKLEPVIQRVVAHRYGMGRDDLLNSSHESRFTHPRALAMAVSSRMLRHSTNEIGRWFSRDHSTVVHALRKVARLEAESWMIGAELEDIAREVANRCAIPWAEVTAKGGFG